MKTHESGKDTNVLRKTPEEIKKGLEFHYVTRRCKDCPYTADEEFKKTCFQLLSADALAYIQQLEAHLAQAERERDALMHDVSKCRRCETCAKRRIPIHKCPHFDGGTQYPCWQWRGVCPENTKEESV